MDYAIYYSKHNVNEKLFVVRTYKMDTLDLLRRISIENEM